MYAYIYALAPHRRARLLLPTAPRSPPPHRYDIDGDGTISMDEMPMLLKDLGAVDVTRTKVELT